jgi:hypothetical protein
MRHGQEESGAGVGNSVLKAIYLAHRRIVSSCCSGSTEVIWLQGSHL